MPVPQYLHVYVRLTSLSPNLGKIGHCGISISEKLKLETKGFCLEREAQASLPPPPAPPLLQLLQINKNF